MEKLNHNYKMKINLDYILISICFFELIKNNLGYVSITNIFAAYSIKTGHDKRLCINLPKPIFYKRQNKVKLFFYMLKAILFKSYIEELLKISQKKKM